MMINPTGAADVTGEWFELYNPTATTLQLAGCIVSTNNDPDFAIDVDLAIPPGGAVSLGKSATGITDLDFTYDDGFDLANGANGDFLTVTCGGAAIDTVTYSTALGFTVPAARSLSLDPGSFTAAGNDAPANWCPASTTGANFTSGDQGTPGEANPVCGGSGNFTIAECRLQFPTTIQQEEGTSIDIFGRVLAAGLTDVNQTGNDPNALLLASVGFGPDGTDPAVDPAWVFAAAAPNPGYVTGSPNFEPTFDEYFRSFTVPAAAGSPYDYAVRFSGDGGVTWTYCDTDGSANGYLAAMAGQLVSEPTTQVFELFFSEYIERSTGSNKALEIYNLGGDVDLGACVVNRYSNGSAAISATQILPAVSLPSGGTFVLCDAGATEIVDGSCDLDSSVTNFNGDDVLELVCASVTLDVFGQIGVDPGTAWGTNPEDTDEVILRRECAILVGDTDGSNVFDPGPEWIGINYSAAEANVDLGQHCP